MIKKLAIGVDKIAVCGPKVDNSWSIRLDTGEYMKPQVAKLLGSPVNTPVTVTFEWDDFPDAFPVAANVEPEAVEHFLSGLSVATDK